MIKISTVLPLRYRLDIKIIRVRIPRRDVKIPSSSKISAFFRRVFEHKHVRRVLGSNIALAVIASSFLPVSASNISDYPESTYISSNVVSLKTEGHIQYPIGKVKLNQGYSFFHPGVDFEGITGDPVNPVMAGVVEAVQYSKVAYGNSILIDHGNDYVSLYAHLSKIYVKPG